jgi:hypothetical protein
MPETVSLEFIGRRLDAVQADVADVRRRIVSLLERHGGLLDRLENIDVGVGRLERRMNGLEVRMDAMVERQSKQEELLHRALLLLERIAAKVGVEAT